jgi:hypothetical protein
MNLETDFCVHFKRVFLFLLHFCRLNEISFKLDFAQLIYILYLNFIIIFNILNIQGDQEGLFKLVMLNFIFKWYN